MDTLQKEYVVFSCDFGYLIRIFGVFGFDVDLIVSVPEFTCLLFMSNWNTISHYYVCVQ